MYSAICVVSGSTSAPTFSELPKKGPGNPPGISTPPPLPPPSKNPFSGACENTCRESDVMIGMTISETTTPAMKVEFA